MHICISCFWAENYLKMAGYWSLRAGDKCQYCKPSKKKTTVCETTCTLGTHYRLLSLRNHLHSFTAQRSANVQMDHPASRTLWKSIVHLKRYLQQILFVNLTLLFPQGYINMLVINIDAYIHMLTFLFFLFSSDSQGETDSRSRERDCYHQSTSLSPVSCKYCSILSCSICLWSLLVCKE